MIDELLRSERDNAKSAQANAEQRLQEAMGLKDAAVNRIRVMGGYFGLTEDQTEDLAEDVRQFLGGGK